MKLEKLALRGRISLQFAVTVTFMVMLVLTLGAIITLQMSNQGKMLKNLSNKVISAEVAAVRSDLNIFLRAPALANRMAAVLLTEQYSNLDKDLSQFEAPFTHILEKIFPDQKHLSLISFGSIHGEYIAVSREILTNKFSLLLKDGRTGGSLNFYSGLKSTDSILHQFNPYDPRVRPWYAPVSRSKKTMWTTAYQDYDAIQGVTISFSSPLYDKNKKMIGVVASDIKLSNFNQYLKSSPNLGRGAIYIVDQHNELISHSSNEKRLPILSINELSKQDSATLLKAKDSSNEMVRMSAKFIENKEINDIEFNLGDEKIYGRVFKLADDNGLNWRIVILIPERDLLGDLIKDMMVTLAIVLCIGLIAALAAWKILASITKPILLAAQTAKLLAKQEWQPTIAGGLQLKETTLLANAFDEMSSALSSSFEQLNYRIRHDQVTGLLSREGLREEMSELVKKDAASKWDALLLIGLDNYRSIHDSIGYDQGEELLCAIVNNLKQHLPEQALFARVADTEFVICMDIDVGKICMTELIQGILDSFTQSFHLQYDEVLISASLGVVSARFNHLDLIDNLRNASMALNKAKGKGASSYEIFQSDMVEQSTQKIHLISELNAAIEKNEFRVYFQPVVRLSDSKVIGAEALVRWQSGQRGLVSPGLFIPLAEESGLILPIGHWVLRESCRQIAERLKNGWASDFDVHVNVSVRQLIQSDFYQVLEATLQEFDLPPHNLTLEITESILIEDSNVIATLIGRIRSLGVEIAIDDFGTGYSSMSYLHQFAFDCLKIDQSFVSRFLDNHKSEAIVSAIIRLAGGFDVPLVAEGVETAEQAQRLLELGCQRAQGYYFGRPIPLEDWPAVWCGSGKSEPLS
ncbi:EAL domain-containing protein [Iodobacter sp.]|uniref:bifunctional diguanylate cyclase/phosphodiesterase n=1 Tax=Iodobacter sp. TaxID=1915058 RepID=UPI0025D3F6A7|nr:EAL domain-containing protein [Iodobacter sp.]